MSSTDTTTHPKRRTIRNAAAVLLFLVSYVFSHAPIHWLVFEYSSMFHAAALSHSFYLPAKFLKDDTICGVVLEPWYNFCGHVVYSIRNPGRPEALW